MADNFSSDSYHVITEEEHRRESPFYKELGGDSPRTRVLEHLVSNKGVFFSYQNLSEATDLELSVIEQVISELHGEGVVLSRENSLYSLNEKHPRATYLIGLLDTITWQNYVRARKEAQREYQR